VIIVVDTSAPEFVSVPESELTVACDDIPEIADVTATDNCSETVDVEFNETMTDEDEDGNYQILRQWIATDDCDNRTEFVQTITVEGCFVKACTIDGITISKVVTPAMNDGINDYFEISDVRTCGFIPAVKIFNRWGQLVYESDNYYNDWDGYHNNSGITIGSGGKLPTGTYYYIVNIGGSGFNTITGYIYLGTN